MQTTNLRPLFKIKVTSEDAEAVQAALDELRNFYAGRCSTSPILSSGDQGCHGFITVYRRRGLVTNYLKEAT